MTITVTIRVDGLRQLGERMRTLKSDIALKAGQSATAAAAAVIKKLAIAKVISSPSVVTGSLRDSIIIKRLGKRDTNLTSEHIVTVRGRGKKTDKKIGGKQNNAPHAHFIEFGTVNMPAEPFLRPAFDQGKEKALDALVDQLRKQIEKAGG